MRHSHVTFDSKLTFETHLCKVLFKAARSLGAVRRAGKLFDCSRVINSDFNACVLPNLEHSPLSLLNGAVRSAERLCEGELLFGSQK